ALFDRYIHVESGHYQLAREFHFADYVTDAWDEMLNPSRPRSDHLYDKIAAYLRAHACADYRAAPEAYAAATGRTQDPHDYVWSAAPADHRFAPADICR